MPLYDHANQLHNQMEGLASRIYADERQSYRDLEAKTVGLDFKRLETDYDELENMIKDKRYGRPEPPVARSTQQAQIPSQQMTQNRGHVQ
jgi:hypothetical protein